MSAPAPAAAPAAEAKKPQVELTSPDTHHATAFMVGTVGWVDNPEGNKPMKVRISHPGPKGESQNTRVVVWGADAQAAVKKLAAKGTKVRVAGELRLDEYGENPTETAVEIHIGERCAAGWKFEAADQETDGCYAEVLGNVSFIGDVEKIARAGKEELSKRRVVVTSARVGHRFAYPMEMIGKGAEEAPAKGALVVATLRWENRLVTDKNDATKKRSFADLSIPTWEKDLGIKAA